MRRSATAVFMAAAIGVTTVTSCGSSSGKTKTYIVASSAMEPTLHCGHPAPGCEASSPDRVEVAAPADAIKRGDVVVFKAPRLALERCGAGGIFIKRVIGLPGERWSEMSGYVYVNGKRLSEAYIKPGRRGSETHAPVMLESGDYFVMGDNRSFSCDSRVWGPVQRANVIGPVTKVLRPN